MFEKVRQKKKAPARKEVRVAAAGEKIFELVLAPQAKKTFEFVFAPQAKIVFGIRCSPFKKYLRIKRAYAVRRSVNI